MFVGAVPMTVLRAETMLRGIGTHRARQALFRIWFPTAGIE